MVETTAQSKQMLLSVESIDTLKDKLSDIASQAKSKQESLETPQKVHEFILAQVTNAFRSIVGATGEDATITEKLFQDYVSKITQHTLEPEKDLFDQIEQNKAEIELSLLKDKEAKANSIQQQISQFQSQLLPLLQIKDEEQKSKIQKVIDSQLSLFSSSINHTDYANILIDQMYHKAQSRMQASIQLDSQIVDSSNLITLVYEWLGNSPNLKLELLYRGSRDGYTADAFHKKCDNQGPTITFILSDYGKKFGGYASVSWASVFGQHVKDENAFVFSLTNKSKHLQQPDTQKTSIYHSKDFLTVFDDGDICIKSNCNANSDSFSNFGVVYELPEGMKAKTEATRNYLAGRYKFKVLEIEVFKVVIL